MRYIEWLTTPPQFRNPRTEGQLAAELDVYPKTLFNWKQDREFCDVWHAETQEVIGGEDRRQAIMDTLYEAANDARNPRHVAAAKLYLEAIGAMSPGRMDVTVHSDAKALGMLTDEEINSLLAQGIADRQDPSAVA
jgi:hypothetical protein